MKTEAENLDEQIRDYECCINAGWHLVAPDIEDAMNTAYVRDEIHTTLQSLLAKGDFFDTSKLRKLDEIWQDQLLGYIRSGEVKDPFYARQNEPLSKWWLHIESLDPLSDQDLSTL